MQTPRASRVTVFQPSCHLQLKQLVPQGICLFSFLLDEILWLKQFIKAHFIFPFMPCDTDANGEQ